MLLCYVMLCFVVLLCCYVMLCCVMLCCYVMLCFVVLCYVVMLCCVVLCYVTHGHNLIRLHYDSREFLGVPKLSSAMKYGDC